MWKASAGISTPEIKNDPDDWETDPDFVNDVDEHEQRWGSKTVEGSGRTAAAIDMKKLIEETAQNDADCKIKQLNDGPKAAFGYGGKFGVQQDRMDKSAVGHDYVTPLMKHESQKDYATGFGGKFGVQTDRQDKSAVGWDHVESAQKHQSQKDYAYGFGGKFGVQSDRQDKSAVGWEHVEVVPKHESQIDHKIGFGGKYGIQSDRVDKSALSFDEAVDNIGTKYEKVKPDIGSAKPSSLRAKFEQMAKLNESSAKEKALEERKRRESRDKMELEREEAKLKRESLSEPVVVNPPPVEPVVVKPPPVEPVKAPIIEPVATTYIEPVPAPIVEPEPEPETVTNSSSTQVIEQVEEEEVEVQETIEEVIKTETGEDDEQEAGYTAIALYDYQAAADDEISFDPDDIITNIEMIDEGWWRGLCKGVFGLFPANYVQLQQ